MQISTTVTDGFRNYWSHVVAFSPNARLFLLSNLLGGIVISIYSLLFNFYLLSLGYQQDFLGLIASLGQLIVFAAALPAGMVSNALGRKRGLILAVAATTISLLGLLVFTSVEGIIAVTVLYGASTALFIVSMSPFMIENSGAQERTHLFSMNQAVIAVAGVAGGVVGGNAPAWLGAWLGVSASDVRAYQAGIFTAGLVNLVSLLPLLMLHAAPSSARNVARRPLSGARRDGRTLFKLLFPNLLIGMGAGLLIPFNNVFLRERYGVNDSEVGTIFSLMAIVAGISIALGPVVAQRFGKMRAIIAAQSLSVPLLLLAGFSPLALLCIVGFMLRPSLMQLSGPIFDAFAMESVRDETRATYSSLNQMVWTVGWIVSPLVSGVIQVQYGWSPLVLGMAALYAAGIVPTQWFFGGQVLSTKP